MKVIAVSGWKRSGKDTVAQMLVKAGFQRMAFADVLKDMVAIEYGIPREHCDSDAHKEAPILSLPVNPRDSFSLNLSKHLYKEFRDDRGRQPTDYYLDDAGQFSGTCGRDLVQLYWTPRALCILKGSSNRTVTSDYWVQRLIKDIGCVQDSGNVQLFVVSDLRFRSEVEQLKEAFGDNLVTVRINRFDTNPSADASENDLNDHKFDITIENRGTLEELDNKVKELLCK